MIAHIAGQCIAMAKVVLPEKLCLRPLYHVLLRQKRWEEPMILTEGCVRELQWWYKNVECLNCRFLSSKPISRQIFTDPSDRGWLASLNGYSPLGPWDRETFRQSINYRELSAVLLALHSFRPLLQSSGHVVKVMTDNIAGFAAAANIHHLGGPNPGLTYLTRSLWAFTYSLSVTLTASQQHISTTRRGAIDLYATWANYQPPRYNSRSYDPGAVWIDYLAKTYFGIQRTIL